MNMAKIGLDQEFRRFAVLTWQDANAGDLIRAGGDVAYVVRAQTDDMGIRWVQVATPNTDPASFQVDATGAVEVLVPADAAAALDNLRAAGMIS